LDIHNDGTAPVAIEVLKAPLSEAVLWIQAGALSNPDSAERLRQKLADISTKVGAGDWTVGIYPKEKGDITLHRVRIGPVPESEVPALIEALSNEGFAKPVLLSQHQLER
jgi:rare lipoprotein A